MMSLCPGERSRSIFFVSGSGYAFNTRTFLDTFIQYNSERQEITSNVRFNLIHHSLSDLFIVYTEENPTIAQASTDRVISIKYTHLLPF